MGGGMKRHTLCGTMRLACMMSIACISIDSVNGQPLVDPMRPPAGLYSVPGGATVPAIAPARLAVHTIIIRPDRRYAVIDGRTLEVGDQIRGMRVVRIEESGVVLRELNGKKLGLELLAGIDKKDSASTTLAKRAALSARAPEQ